MTETTEAGRKKDRDFTKANDLHRAIAEYVNSNSGTDPVSDVQVKAVLLLREDFNKTPERQAAIAEAKERRAAENAEFAGKSPEQVKVIRAAKRKAESAQKLADKAAEAMAKAKALQDAAEANGEDLADAVALLQAERDERAAKNAEAAARAEAGPVKRGRPARKAKANA